MAVTSDDQLVQVGALLCVQASQAKVIQDQQVGGQVAAEDLLKGVVGACLAQLSEQLVGAHEQHAFAGAHRRRAEGLNHECFADADGSNDQDVLLALQELQREHVLELATVKLNGSRPIKVVQGDALLETSLQQVALQ